MYGCHHCWRMNVCLNGWMWGTPCEARRVATGSGKHDINAIHLPFTRTSHRLRRNRRSVLHTRDGFAFVLIPFSSRHPFLLSWHSLNVCRQTLDIYRKIDLWHNPQKPLVVMTVFAARAKGGLDWSIRDVGTGPAVVCCSFLPSLLLHLLLLLLRPFYYWSFITGEKYETQIQKVMLMVKREQWVWSCSPKWF